LLGYHSRLNLKTEAWQAKSIFTDIAVRAMNQKSKQLLSTIQQIKLRQLEIEVETLEKQIENTVKVEEEYAEEIIQSSVSYVRINEIKEKTVIKLS